MLKEDLQSKCILNEISTIIDILLKKAELNKGQVLLLFPPVRSTSSVFAASLLFSTSSIHIPSSFWNVGMVRELSLINSTTSATVIWRYSFHLIRSKW
jgi:hypothetical protein